MTVLASSCTILAGTRSLLKADQVLRLQVLKALASKGVRFIAMRCAGYDRVDLRAAAELGIRVARVPTYSPHSVAEHAVAMLLCLNRNLHLAYNRVRSGDYSLSGLEGFEVRCKTIGVMGTGAIGTAAASIFKVMMSVYLIRSE